MANLLTQFDRILRLPIEQQVRCLVRAVERAFPIWEDWEARRHPRSRLGAALLQACRGWAEGTVASEHLNGLRKKFRPREKKALFEDKNSILEGYVGYALHAIPLIALRQCEDVHDDIFITSVVDCARAVLRIPYKQISIDLEALPDEIAEWITGWCVECCEVGPDTPVVLGPELFTRQDRAIPKLARAIDAEGRFSDLPILADALEEAGCSNADILHHCRQPGEHFRGCWVVDLVLGKN
jgi:hypothetical protein